MTSFLRPYTTRADNSFDKKRIKDYIITIQCSLDGFSYSVFDETIATFIVLEHYNIIKQDAGIEQVIDEFQERKNIELQEYKRAVILIDNTLNTFVPANFFLNKHKDDFMRFLNLSDDDSFILTDYIARVDINNIFAINKSDGIYLNNLPENVTIAHASSVMINSLINENLNRNHDSRVFVNVKNDYFELVIMNGCILVFHNYFRYKTTEDFVYFLIFATSQFNIDNETVPLYFLGHIENTSKILELCSRYFRDIRFMRKPVEIQLTKDLEEEPYHQHYIIYNAIKCEL